MTAPPSRNRDRPVRGESLAIQHPGIFFEMGPSELARLRQAGYRRIGVGIVLLNLLGEVLVIEHRGNHKVADGSIGLISETVMGSRNGTQTEVEPVKQTIRRCVSEELGVDAADVHATTRIEEPFVLSDWPVGTDSSLGWLLGINVSLLLDDEAASRCTDAVSTPEAKRAYFTDIDALLTASSHTDLVRPGTEGCLLSLRDSGLLEVTHLTDARLDLSGVTRPPGAFDVDLLAEEYLSES